MLAYTFDPRTDKTCRELLALLTPFNIGMLTTDEWGSYARELPKEKHLTGKSCTQRIERNNLTLRTRLKRLTRKTICFSRSVEIHEIAIGAFIENTCSTNWRHHLTAKRIETELSARFGYVSVDALGRKNSHNGNNVFTPVKSKEQKGKIILEKPNLETTHVQQKN